MNTITFSLLQMALMNENMTILDTSYLTFLNETFKSTILNQLDAGTYYLKIFNPKTHNVGIALYNLTLTTKIYPQQHTISYHNGLGTIVNGTEVDFGQRTYQIFGTVLANSTLQVNIKQWPLGTFHTDLYPWQNESLRYTIDDTTISNSNSSEIGFVSTSQLSLKFNNSKSDCDFLLVINVELQDQYDLYSSMQNPYELHRRNAGTTYDFTDPTLSYPNEVDWWQFTPPVLGRLNVTFTSAAKLNVTVYNENGTLTPVTSSSFGNSITYNFGEINSTFVLSVSLLNPADLFTQYNITVTYLETYIPIVLTGNTNAGGGNSNSVLTRYLLELGGIFVIAIVIMIVIQEKIKNSPKDLLD